MKNKFLLLLILLAMLMACSPHQGAGKWKAIDENSLGIKDLSILFEGKAEFVTTKKDIAVWHCFWGGENKAIAAMNCVPSTDTERREKFEFIVQSEEQGQLKHNGEIIGTFQRQPYE